MCIALTQPVGKSLTDDEIYSCWKSNPDGGGFAFAVDNKIQIVKETFDITRFIKLYREAVERHGNDSAFIVHFRWGTQGGTADRNTHPFQVNEHLAFCHNGVLSTPHHATLSDTVLYNKEILTKMPKGFEYSEGVMKLIQSDIGRSNKFCFINSAGKTFVINEEAGHYREDGFWFSNSSYRRNTWAKGYSKGTTGCAYSNKRGTVGWEKDEDDWESYLAYGKKPESEKKQTKVELVETILREGEASGVSLKQANEEIIATLKQIQDEISKQDYTDMQQFCATCNNCLVYPTEVDWDTCNECLEMYKADLSDALSVEEALTTEGEEEDIILDLFEDGSPEQLAAIEESIRERS